MIKQLKKIWTHSIQRQLIISIALIHAVLMTIFVFDLVHRQSVFLEKQSQNQCLGLCKTISTNSVSWVLAQDFVGMEEIILSQSQHPDLLYAMLISPQGKVMAHTNDSFIGLFISDSLSLSLLKKKPFPQILVNNSSLIDAASPIFASGKFIGWARVGVSQQIIHNGLLSITRDGIWYTIFAIIIGSVFAIIMGRNITSGLRHLVKVANEIRDGNENARITFKRSDELGNLGKNLNLMIDSIIKQKNIISETQKELKDSEQKLKIHNEQLDKKVEERTKELKNRNKEIEVLYENLASKNENLKELNATKDKFFSIIAHDLKGPFNPLLGFSNLLKENAHKYPPEEVQKIATSISNSTKRAYNLLESLLEWARLQTGKIKPKFENTKPSELIYEVESLCEPAATSKNISIQSVTTCDNNILVDKEMIKTVLRNLINNAIKFTSSEGYVKITTQKSGKNILFSISDSGIGIEEEHIEKLFCIDSKLSKTGTANETGTGLGLILCKEFIERHNGKIWVESEIGKGSDFKFTIPFNQNS